MARSLLRSADDVTQWLGRQSKPVKWCIAPETGRTSLDGWSPFSSVDELPRGRKLLMRAEDAKGGVHVYLPASDGEPGLVPSVPERAALVQKERQLQERERALLAEQSEFLEYQRRVVAEHSAIAAKLDERLAIGMRRASEVEREYRDYGRQLKELLGELREQIERADAAESSGAVAAAISYSVDRLLNSVTIWRAKSLDNVPASMIEDFKSYLDSKASRRMLEYMPNAISKIANSFMELGKDQREAFLHAITQMMQAEARAKKSTAEPPQGTPEDKPRRRAKARRAA